MITLERLDAITERLQTANMNDPSACARILSLLAQFRNSLVRLQAEIAEWEMVEQLIEDLDAYVDSLPGVKGRTK